MARRREGKCARYPPLLLCLRVGLCKCSLWLPYVCSTCTDRLCNAQLLACFTCTGESSCKEVCFVVWEQNGWQLPCSHCFKCSMSIATCTFSKQDHLGLSKASAAYRRRWNGEAGSPEPCKVLVCLECDGCRALKLGGTPGNYQYPLCTACACRQMRIRQCPRPDGLSHRLPTSRITPKAFLVDMADVKGAGNER